MLNERKLTERELDHREVVLQNLLKNKRNLVKRYGKDAEKVMYGIATKKAKTKIEGMNKEKIKELIRTQLEGIDSSPRSNTDDIDANKSYSGGADYGSEVSATSAEDSVEQGETQPLHYSLEEGHGLDQGDIDVLKYMISQLKSGGDLSMDVGARKKMIKVLTFLIKSNIIQDKTKDLSKGKVEEMDANDPVLMKLRALASKKDRQEKAKSRISYEDAMDLRLTLSQLEDSRDRLVRDMEQEAEPEGGPIADRYGDELNKLEDRISSIRKKINDYDMNESLNEAIDGGTLFDYFNKKYIVDDHFHSDDSYIVKREPSGKDQYVIFDYDKDKDQFQIRQMGGYRIDRSEAMKAGMRETGMTRVAGIDSYMVDGNYSPTPISIEGLKDIVDHVMGGLSREAAAQQDFYARRGPTSGTIDEKIAAAVKEKLTKSSSVEDHVEDFKDSDAPQFKGKSLKKIKQMALASFLSKQGKKKVAEGFKVGDKVTYLGHPGEITKVNKEMTGAITYNVSYDKGTGKTKASNIYNKGGEIKAI